MASSQPCSTNLMQAHAAEHKWALVVCRVQHSFVEYAPGADLALRTEPHPLTLPASLTLVCAGQQHRRGCGSSQAHALCLDTLHASSLQHASEQRQQPAQRQRLRHPLRQSSLRSTGRGKPTACTTSGQASLAMRYRLPPHASPPSPLLCTASSIHAIYQNQKHARRCTLLHAFTLLLAQDQTCPGLNICHEAA